MGGSSLASSRYSLDPTMTIPESAKENILLRLRSSTSLDEKSLRKLIEQATHRTSKPGEDIIKEGDQSNFAVLLLSGSVKVLVTGRDGQEVILSIVDAAALLGEIGLLDKSPRSATVRTVQEATYLRIDRQH